MPYMATLISAASTAGRPVRASATSGCSTWAVVGMLLFPGINANTIGGWFGSLEFKEADAPLGALDDRSPTPLGFGVIAMVAIPVDPRDRAADRRRYCLTVPVLIPLADLRRSRPAPVPDKRLASESFGRFAGDVGSPWCADPSVWPLLSSVHRACGVVRPDQHPWRPRRHYHASEVFGRRCWEARRPPRPGVLGRPGRAPARPARAGRATRICASARPGWPRNLSCTGLSLTPSLFAYRHGRPERVVELYAITLVNVLALQSRERTTRWPRPSSACSRRASNLPITYMQWVDGHAYGRGGLRLMYLADGGIGLVACVILALLLGLWGRKRRRVPRRREA